MKRKEVLVRIDSNLLCRSRWCIHECQFQPAMVKQYRLIGFNNKKEAIAESDNDLEGGESEAGTITMAIFELIPTQQSLMSQNTKYLRCCSQVTNLNTACYVIRQPTCGLMRWTIILSRWTVLIKFKFITAVYHVWHETKTIAVYKGYWLEPDQRIR